MPASVTFIEGGAITTPLGFLAGATYAGIKTYAEDKLDLGLLLSERPAATAGVYTTSAIVSPSVTLTRERVSKTGSPRPGCEQRNSQCLRWDPGLHRRPGSHVPGGRLSWPVAG